jgi:hypothetical protein
MNTLVSSFCKGVDYCYVPTSERAGTMEVRFATNDEVPLCVFVTVVPTVETFLDACGVKGVIGQPERLSPNTARFTVQW